MRDNGQAPKKFYQDLDWAFEHAGELGKRFGDGWVAVHHRHVVAFSRSLRQVETRARAKLHTAMFPVLFIESRTHLYQL